MVNTDVFDVSEDDIAEGKLEEKKKQTSPRSRNQGPRRKLDRSPTTRRSVSPVPDHRRHSEQIRDPEHADRASRADHRNPPFPASDINDLEERKEEIETARAKSRKKATFQELEPQIKIWTGASGRPEGNRLDAPHLRRIIRGLRPASKSATRQKELVAANLRLVSRSPRNTATAPPVSRLIRRGTWAMMKAVGQFEYRRGYKSRHTRPGDPPGDHPGDADQARTIRIPSI
jgi:RNA polymerase primary sigma factor